MISCVEYLNWVHDNPLYKDQLVTFQGSASDEAVAQMHGYDHDRPFSVSGIDQSPTHECFLRRLKLVPGNVYRA